jgi:hypothetical protein
MKRKGNPMKSTSWLMGLFATAMLMLIACGVEPESQVAPKEAEESAQPANLAAGDVRINALTNRVEPPAACSPVGTSEDCCPFPQGCSCTGLRFCELNGT